MDRQPLQSRDVGLDGGGTPPAADPGAARVAHEHDELVNAPLVQLGPPLGRCHFCGRLARNLTLVEVVNGQERLRGECCNG